MSIYDHLMYPIGWRSKVFGGENLTGNYQKKYFGFVGISFALRVGTRKHIKVIKIEILFDKN